MIKLNLRQLKERLYKEYILDLDLLNLTSTAKNWLEQEMKRVEEMSFYEKALYKKGFNLIGGVDEAGRGPLVGPVVAACVILPKGVFIPEIKDSKKLSENKREILAEIIKRQAVAYGIGIVDHDEIDEINILNATLKAMKKAVFAVKEKIDCLLV
ncbi:MAG: ribonuclease HII, partial [Caldanaerobacter sp.]